MARVLARAVRPDYARGIALAAPGDDGELRDLADRLTRGAYELASELAKVQDALAALDTATTKAEADAALGALSEVGSTLGFSGTLTSLASALEARCAQIRPWYIVATHDE